MTPEEHADARRECADLLDHEADRLTQSLPPPAGDKLDVVTAFDVVKAGVLRDMARRIRSLADAPTLGVPRREYGEGPTPSPPTAPTP